MHLHRGKIPLKKSNHELTGGFFGDSDISFSPGIGGVTTWFAMLRLQQRHGASRLHLWHSTHQLLSANRRHLNQGWLCSAPAPLQEREWFKGHQKFYGNLVVPVGWYTYNDLQSRIKRLGFHHAIQRTVGWMEWITASFSKKRLQEISLSNILTLLSLVYHSMPCILWHAPPTQDASPHQNSIPLC